MNGKTRMLLAGLVVVLLAVLVWVLGLNPLREEIGATEAEIEEEQTRLAQAQTQLAQAEMMQEEGRKNQARLLELAKMMPTSDEVPSLLLQIQDLANQSGIDFTAITPGQTEETESGDYQVLPLDLQFSGTFFDVSDFVYRAEQMVAGPGRLLAVKDLGLSLESSEEELSTETSPKLGVTLTVYAFVAGGEGESAAPPPASPEAGSDASASTSDTETGY